MTTVFPISANDETLSLGAWCSVPSSYSTELMAAGGFDWMCIDWQHGMLDYSQVIPMLQAATITRLPTLVRVPSAEPASIMKVLDAGATGVLVPLVNTAEQAKRAVDACNYPPLGSRSWGPARASLLSSPFTPVSANAAVVCAVQIETVEAVKNLDSILEVAGVDIAFVGPSDLAVSLNQTPVLGPMPGRHSELIIEIAKRTRERGVTPAIYCGSVAASIAFHEMGYRMLAAASDALLIREGASTAVRELRKALPSPDQEL
jgi:4-hydroxy-2-oxoheptanedioate aldolase